VVIQFEILTRLQQEESHAKTQSRKESAQGEEAFNSLAVFLAALRLCVRLPFSSPRTRQS
jgi:hypothetical protein